MRGYYESAYDQNLPPECSCSLAGCEYDYQSNTYRLEVLNLRILMQKFKNFTKATLETKTSKNFATHYIVLRLDVKEGLPKLVSIR